MIYFHSFIWDMIIHTCPEFNACLVKPLQLMDVESHRTVYVDIITYSCLIRNAGLCYLC